MLHNRRIVLHIDIRECVRPACVAQQQAVALRVIPASCRIFRYFHRTPVAVLAMSGRNALRHDGAARVFPHMDHLRARIGLLAVVGHCHRVKFARRVVALQHATRIFPRDCRAGLHLRPRQFREIAATQSAFRHEIINAATTILVARIPILNGGIFHLGTILHHDFHNRRMKLVFVAHRSRAAFQIRHVGIVVGHNERTLELPRSGRIDSEISRQFHRAANAFGNIDKRTVGEYGRIKRGKKIVVAAHHRSQILPHQIGIVFHCL